MSAVTAIYHIVINTYHREMSLPLPSCDQLYRYIARVVQNHNSVLYAVGLIQVKAVGLAVVFDHYLPLPFIGGSLFQ